ncbi:putative tetratricopeptide repeat protein 41 isoform X2 [Hyla sarda]|uniref:putative tetratricopeptide repeat protein 41 isoform X2 n=1 Tax=Hyla sarda TaxID=327740 RepID=UPI0024C3996F|nr:putative tetratricopeptide repeat protein 41 isoform X2 [Hyla sarda]
MTGEGKRRTRLFPKGPVIIYPTLNQPPIYCLKARTMPNHSTEKDHQYCFTSRPPICPYVCSTPRDFIEERNYLADTIFPQLDNLCFTRGTSFKPVDLKWQLEKRSNNVDIQSHVHHHIAHEQLKLCLDYINHLTPFFICILGHTYGECVPQSQIRVSSGSADISDDDGLSEVEKNLLVAAHGGYPWVLEGSNKTCSLTELEVIQALLFKDAESQYFYFRDYQYIEDRLQHADEKDKWSILSSFATEHEVEELRIWELKANIVDQGLPVRFFTTKEELGALVLKDWCNVIEKRNPLNNIPVHIGHEHNLALAYHQAYTERLSKDFVASQGLNKLFTVLDTFACGHLTNEQSDKSSIDPFNWASSRLETEKSILLLHGERGSGKSTAIAKWLHSFKESSHNISVISFFVGSSGQCDNIMDFMRHSIILLRCTYFGIQVDDVYSNENINDLWEFPLLVEAFLASVALKPCVLVLDGVDRLSGIHGVNAHQTKGFDWLPARLPHECKMIVTTRSAHLSYKSLISRSDVQIEELQMKSDTEERLCIFHKHLAMPSRKVPPYLMESFENKKRKISPLQLTVLASELRICPDVAYCIDSPLETVSTEQLWSLLIKHWVKHFSWSYEWKMKNKAPKSAFGSDIHNSGWVVDVLCFLTTSHCGLHEDDILQLLKRIGYRNQYEVTPLHWSAFRLATLKWIREKPDGLLQIHPQSFHDAVVHLVFGNATSVVESLDYTSQNTVSRKRRQFHLCLLKYFQQKELSRQAFDEVPWHLKMTGKLHDLYSFLLNRRTLDLIRRNMKHGCEMKMDLIHYWQMLLHSGKEPAVECQSLLDNITEHTVDMADQCKVILFAAQCLKDIGKTKEAASILSSIEYYLEVAESRNNKALMWTQKVSGDLYRDIGSWQKAIIYYKKALDNLQCLNMNDLQTDYKLMELRDRLLCIKATLEVKICYEQQSKILENPIEKPNPHTTGPYVQAALKLWQGLYKFCIGDISESEKYLVDCLDIRHKLYGKNHILYGEVQEYIADIQIHLGSGHYSQRQCAIENYRNVIKIEEETEKRCPSPERGQYLRLRLSNTLVKAGKLLSYDHLGNRNESVEMLQRSLDLRTSIVGTDHPLTYEVQLYLKELHCRPHWISKVPPLSEDDKHIPSKSEISQRKSYSAQPRRHHLSSECGKRSPGALHSLPESRSDNFLLRYCSEGGPMTHLPLLKKSDHEEFYEQTENSEAVPVFPSKSFGRSPASVTSCLIQSLCSRPESACQSSLSGPHSDLLSLVSISRPSSTSKHKLVHKSAWYHVPGRYPTLQTPFPPKRHQLRKDI